MLEREGQFRNPSGCAISGVIDRSGKRMSGQCMIDSIATMHDRSNGLGGGEIAGNFCGTGMHGGQIVLRTDTLPPLMPAQVKAEKIEVEKDGEISSIIEEYCKEYGIDSKAVCNHTFYRLTPDTDNPYQRMYTNN